MATDIVILALVLTVAIAAVTALSVADRKRSIACLATAGVLCSAIFLLRNAPDLAVINLLATAAVVIILARVVVRIEKTVVIYPVDTFSIAAVFLAAGVVVTILFRQAMSWPQTTDAGPTIGSSTTNFDLLMTARPSDLIAVVAILFVLVLGTLGSLRRGAEE